MQMKSHLINQSDLLGTIVVKIETSYSDPFRIRLSSYDFFFVPTTQKGDRLGYQFILNNIGYDLWSGSWERLTNISYLEEQLASILMDE